MHTIQDARAWDQLAGNAVLSPDRDREEPYYKEAYAWMDRQMAARGLPGDGMLWLWARFRRRDLVQCAALARDEVLITVRVPADRVLLSDFVDWHCALNDAPLVNVLPGESDDAWERRYDAAEAAGRGCIEATWQAIFDRYHQQERGDIQATIRVIRASDVVRAVRIAPGLRRRLEMNPAVRAL